MEKTKIETHKNWKVCQQKFFWKKHVISTLPLLFFYRNFKLLSFGEEAEEDEEESSRENVKFVGKGKSSHDILSKSINSKLQSQPLLFNKLLDDPKLSAKTDEHSDKEEAINPEEQLENIRKKLKTNNQKKTSIPKPSTKINEDSDNEFEEYYLFKDRDLDRKKKM